ncbi:MAG: hypothetical protein Q7R85_00365 [bacterium]|nr:hypothetical protein [bacterium]
MIKALFIIGFIRFFLLFAMLIPGAVFAAVAPVAPPVQDLGEPYISISPDYFYPLEEVLYIEGRGDPRAVVTVTLRADNQPPVKFTAVPDSTGEWVVAEKTYLRGGNWEVRARQSVGAIISDWSNPRIIRSVVTGVNVFGLRIRYVVIAGVIFAFLSILGVVLLYFRKKIKTLRRGLMEKQLQAAEERFDHGFAEIRKELMDQLRDLAQSAKRRALTTKEIEQRDRVLAEIEKLEHELHHDIGNIEKGME